MASKISQEKTQKERLLKKYEDASSLVQDAVEFFEMAKLENDEESLEMIFEDAPNLNETIKSLEVAMMLKLRSMIATMQL